MIKKILKMVTSDIFLMTVFALEYVLIIFLMWS